MNEPSIDFVYPDDEPDIERNLYRQAARKYLRLINNIIDYIEDSDNKTVATWIVCYAIGSFKCQGITMSDKAAQLGLSVQAFQKRVKQLERQIKIENNPYTNDK